MRPFKKEKNYLVGMRVAKKDSISKHKLDENAYFFINLNEFSTGNCEIFRGATILKGKNLFWRGRAAKKDLIFQQKLKKNL